MSTTSHQLPTSTEPTVSVLVPLYLARPWPDDEPGLRALLEPLADQPGPLEVLLAATGPARRNPLEPLLAELRGRGYPHRLRSFHHQFDPVAGRPRSRAASLNAAAAVAAGEVLLVLHSDNRLPPEGIAEIRRAVSAGYRSGAFPKRYDPQPPGLAVQAWWLNEWRLRARKHSVGTNAVWLTRDLWRDLPDQALLEDLVLSDRLRQELGLTGIYVSRLPLWVSAEKYLRTGLLASVAINVCVMFLYRVCRVSPQTLRDELYSREKLPLGTVRFWPALVRQVCRAWRLG